MQELENNQRELANVQLQAKANCRIRKHVEKKREKYERNQKFMHKTVLSHLDFHVQMWFFKF